MKRSLAYLILAWLLLFVGSRAGLCQVKIIYPEFEAAKTVDICGSDYDKTAILLFDIGEIEQSDSLFGYDFALRYNPDKIRFSTAIWTNTLSENITGEFSKRMSFGSGENRNIIEGYAVVLSISQPPLSGDKPLFGIAGRFQGDCPDTSHIYLEYIEFTDEFKPAVAQSASFTVKAVAKDEPERYFRPELPEDTLKFEEDSIMEVDVMFDYGSDTRANELVFEIKIADEDEFIIKSLHPIDQNFVITNEEEVEGGYRVKAGIEGNIKKKNVLKAEIKQIKNDDVLSNLTVDVIDTDECSCVTREGSSTLTLRGYRTEDTTSVIQQRENPNTVSGYYDERNTQFVFESAELMKRLLIFDIKGNLTDDVNLSFEKETAIDAARYSNGIYFAIVETESGNNKIILIKMK